MLTKSVVKQSATLFSPPCLITSCLHLAGPGMRPNHLTISSLLRIDDQKHRATPQARGKNHRSLLCPSCNFFRHALCACGKGAQPQPLARPPQRCLLSMARHSCARCCALKARAQRERERVCVCMCLSACECVCVCVCVCVRKCCVCVRVCQCVQLDAKRWKV